MFAAPQVMQHMQQQQQQQLVQMQYPGQVSQAYRTNINLAPYPGPVSISSFLSATSSLRVKIIVIVLYFVGFYLKFN